MGNVAGKVWGTTQQVWMGSSVEVHVIKIKRGGRCSLHTHGRKHNLFHVISGVLVVESHKADYDLVDETQLLAGDTHVVPPGELHRFTAHSDVLALEVYWVELSPDDIDRQDVGCVVDLGGGESSR